MAKRHLVATSLIGATLVCSAIAVGASAANLEGRAVSRHVWSGIDYVGALPGESLVANTPAEAQAEARRLGVVVEDVSQRTANHEVFALPDGQWVGRQWLSDVWVPTEGEGWELLDTTLVAGDGGTIEPAAFPAELTLSDGGPGAGSTLLTWEAPGSDVRVELVSGGTDLPTPTVEGSRARYEGVMDGIDIVVDLMPTGFEQYYVVHSAAALESLDSPLGMTYRVTGGSAAAREAGVDILDATGEVVASIPEALAWDAVSDDRVSTPILRPWRPDGAADGEPERLSGASATLVPVPTSAAVNAAGTEVTIAVSPDPAWISSDDTVFPIVIDPAYYSPGFTMDTFVFNGSPDQAYSTNSELLLGRDPSTASKVYRPYLAVPTDVMKQLDLNSATLLLWNQWSATCTQVHYHAYWTGTPSSSVTWNSQPGNTGYYSTSTDTKGHDQSSKPYCGEGWSSMDITAIAQLWQAQSSNSQGLMLGTGDETISARWKRFWSAESSSPYKPQIQYSYNQLPGTPTTLTYVPPTGTTRAKVTAKVADPDGGNVRAAFTISRRPAGSSGAWEILVDKAEGSLVSSGAVSERSVDFVAGYEYQVVAWGYDGRRFSAASSASISFVVTSSSGFTDIPAVNDPTAPTATALGAALTVADEFEGELR